MGTFMVILIQKGVSFKSGNKMDTKLILFAIVCFGGLLTSIEAANRHKIVAYWGQNGVYSRMKERQYWEKDLVHFCKNSVYDVIVLSFLHIFFDHGNKDKMPRLNFAFHCETPVSDEYPFLLRCPKIEAGIKECQKNGKQVLMSLGGAVGPYGFKNVAEAKLFASRVWHLLLEGQDLQSIRPFGTAILDGVDLDIEGGGFFGYTDFVKELRHIEATQGKGRHYTIAAAPQCPYPDGHLGPLAGKALGDVPKEFDEIYIQFYNNWCHTGNKRVFYENIRKWLTYSEKTGGPLIYVGVPANVGGSGNDANYRTIPELAEIYKNVKDEPRFGGIMLWDASFDQNNHINGKIYSEHIAAMFNNGPLPTGKPVTLPPVTKGPTKKPHPGKTTKAPEPSVAPTKPSSVSCKGLNDGMYPHPTDCAKFFQCHHGRAFVKSCPPGLKFNPKNNSCDWPQNVQC